VHIGVIGSNGPDTFGDNIEFTLAGMGHAVTNLGTARSTARNPVLNRATELALQARPDLEGRVHKKMVKAAVDRECDAVITTDGGLAPEAVSELRRHNIPISLWFPDCVANLGRQRMLAAPYTALFFKDRLLVQRLRDTLNLPVWHLPEACNPYWHRPIGEVGRRRVIVVAGNTYLTRLLLLERLHEAGVPLVIYGNRTPRWAPKVIPETVHAGRSVFREEKAQVFREAAGVLNNLSPAEMSGVNARLFEATGCGAAVLCERRPELEQLYDTDREVVPFTDFNELLLRIRELLESPELTQQVGDAASKRAHSEHTYELRLVQMLETMM
jgi:spore maturation protein CgeB